MDLSSIRPLAVGSLDSIFAAAPSGMRLYEVQIADNSPMSGITVSQCCPSTDIQALAITKQRRKLTVTPTNGTVFVPGDEPILVGSNSQLGSLENKG